MVDMIDRIFLSWSSSECIRYFVSRVLEFCQRSLYIAVKAIAGPGRTEREEN
jgi:hypothetical protein